MPRPRRTDPKLATLRRSGTLHARPDMVRDEAFQQNAFFDARDALQVKYEMLRRVRSDGVSVTAAAAAFGLSRPAYYEARRAFTRGGLAGLIRQRPGPRRAHKLSDDVLAYVDDVRGADAATSLVAILHAIQRRFGVTVHRRSLERALARRSKKAR